MRKFILTILSTLALGVSIYAQDDKLNPIIGHMVYPKHVVFLPDNKPDSVIAYSETGLVPIIFEIDKHKYIPSPELDSVAALVNQVLQDKRVDFQYLWIGGSASPEGPVAHNYDLGFWRSEILKNFILENTSVNPTLVRTQNLAEDWEGFRRALIKEKDYPYRDRILEIIDNTSDWDLRKRKIRAIDNGKTWHNLIYGLFTPFRNARMVIVCKAYYNVETKIPPMPPMLLPLPKENMLPKMDASFLPSAETRFFALKNNILFDGILVANLGVEIELWRKTSLDIPFVYSPYDIRVPDRKIRLLGSQPEFRYWLGQKAGEGHFVGIHGALLGFNIALNDKGRFQDPNHALWNAGIGYGYSWNFGKDKRWALEANIGVGYADYIYDSYRNWHNGARFKSNTHESYWGVTRAGLTIMYKWYTPRK